jgi:hypothetical protein
MQLAAINRYNLRTRIHQSHLLLLFYLLIDLKNVDKACVPSRRWLQASAYNYVL